MKTDQIPYSSNEKKALSEKLLSESKQALANALKAIDEKPESWQAIIALESSHEAMNQIMHVSNSLAPNLENVLPYGREATESACAMHCLVDLLLLQLASERKTRLRHAQELEDVHALRHSERDELLAKIKEQALDLETLRKLFEIQKRNSKNFLSGMN